MEVNPVRDSEGRQRENSNGVNNFTSFSLDKKMFRKVAELVFKKEKEKGRISLAFVSSGEIRRINKIYRGKDAVTDVLSFPFGKDNRDFRGEVVVCPRKIKENTEKDSEFFKETLRVVIHGILHIFGYDHESPEDEKKMRGKENLYLKNIFKKVK